MLRTQSGLAYQGTTPAKIPDQPTARACNPVMTVPSRQDKAGSQQAMTKRTRLAGTADFMSRPQFSEGLSTLSITNTSSGSFCRSNLSPS